MKLHVEQFGPIHIENVKLFVPENFFEIVMIDWNELDTGMIIDSLSLTEVKFIDILYTTSQILLSF